MSICITVAPHGYRGTVKADLSCTGEHDERIFDTDLGKLLICLDPQERVWGDANGQIV